MKKTWAAATIAAITVLTACTPLPDKDYHGSSTGGRNPGTATMTAPAVPAVPVTIDGSGEGVETADLVTSGYTVRYRASSWTLIVAPVQEDGSDGISLVNAMGNDPSSGVSGTTTFRAHGRTTFHVSNTRATWSLTFTPLT